MAISRRLSTRIYVLCHSMVHLSVESLTSFGENVIFRQWFCSVKVWPRPSYVVRFCPILVGQRILLGFFGNSLWNVSKVPLSQEPFHRPASLVVALLPTPFFPSSLFDIGRAGLCPHRDNLSFVYRPSQPVERRGVNGQRKDCWVQFWYELNNNWEGINRESNLSFSNIFCSERSLTIVTDCTWAKY